MSNETSAFLKDFFQRQRDPMEPLAADQGLVHSGWLIDVRNLSEVYLKSGKRPVLLACGHFTLTRSLTSARCPRCGEMIRAGYDYDGFRNRAHPDTFSWPQDPFIGVHERDEAMARDPGTYRNPDTRHSP